MDVEYYIKNHRKMWNWIAEQYNCGSKLIIDELKRIYLEANGFKYVYMRCFLCDYDEDGADSVACKERCLLDWVDGSCTSDESPYEVLFRNENLSSQQKAELAMEVANLPVNPIYLNEIEKEN